MNDFFQNTREGDGIPDNVDFDNIKTIEFNKGNWSGEVGRIMIDGDTFTIDGIDGVFTLEFNENGDPLVTNEDNWYLGFLNNDPREYHFEELGVIRYDTHPQVALAKVLYNL